VSALAKIVGVEVILQHIEALPIALLIRDLCSSHRRASRSTEALFVSNRVTELAIRIAKDSQFDPGQQSCTMPTSQRFTNSSKPCPLIFGILAQAPMLRHPRSSRGVAL
jgi:hypothetical protein